MVNTNTEWKESKISNKQLKMYKIIYSGKYKRDDIERIAQKSSDAWQRKGFKGQIQVSLLYPGGNFRNGQSTKLGSPVDIYSAEEYYDEADNEYTKDPKFFKEFYMFVYTNPTKK